MPAHRTPAWVVELADSLNRLAGEAGLGWWQQIALGPRRDPSTSGRPWFTNAPRPSIESNAARLGKR